MELKVTLPRGTIDKFKKSLQDKLEVAAVRAWETTHELLPAAGQTPYSTGQLRQSIRFEQTGELEYTLYCPMSYGIFVEFGTGPKGQATGGMPEFENDPQPNMSYHTGEVYVTRYRGQLLEEPYIRHTQGQVAQPFMRPALMAGMNLLIDLLK